MFSDRFPESVWFIVWVVPANAEDTSNFTQIKWIQPRVSGYLVSSIHITSIAITSIGLQTYGIGHMVIHRFDAAHIRLKCVRVVQVACRRGFVLWEEFIDSGQIRLGAVSEHMRHSFIQINQKICFLRWSSHMSTNRVQEMVFWGRVQHKFVA